MDANTLSVVLIRGALFLPTQTPLSNLFRRKRGQMFQTSQQRFLGQLVSTRKFSDFEVVTSEYQPKQALQKHSHKYAFISLLLRGSYVERCGATEWECRAGQAIFHEPDETHSNVFGDDGGCVLNIELLPHFVPTLEEQGAEARCRRRIDCPQVLHLGTQLHKEANNSDFASRLAVEGLTKQLIAQVLRLDCEPSPQCSAGWIGRVKDLLHSQYDQPLTLDELASQAGVHPVHLARTFSKHYGCTVGTYRRRLRLSAACKDLANPALSIIEIASRNGFSDQSHLTRALKEHTGFSPAKYRQVLGRSQVKQAMLTSRWGNGPSGALGGGDGQ
jgi:AraC family transcriptional regulator